MKVIGIAGSPRRNANSTFLLEEALRGAREEGADTELILIREKEIKPCEACWSCQKTGRCRIEDDLQEIMEKLEAADGIILASPTHVGNISSICQAFLERTHSAIRMKEVNGKLVNVGKTSTLGGKVGGSIVTGRRRGVQGALDVLNYALLMRNMVVAHAGVAGFCKSMEPGAIKDEDKDAVAMARELGTVVATYIKKLALSKKLPKTAN